MTYTSLHTKIRKLWGRASKCCLCKGKRGKRYEWSNKDHKYSLNRTDWWELCSVCHDEYDAKTFGREPIWNKGLKKVYPLYICNCGKKFPQKRKEQKLCSRLCASRLNGTKPKLVYLIENKLIKEEN